VKLESVIETARADEAVVPSSAARERVWRGLTKPRRARRTLLLFTASAALGALICFSLIRFVQRPPEVPAVSVVQGAVQPVAARHVKIDGPAELVLHGPAKVDVGARHIEVEEGVARLRVAADGSGTLQVESGTCFLTDSEGRRRVSGTQALGQQLSEQVALYERGWSQLSADPKVALDVFDELLRRFPNGALVQEARLSRLEALQALGRRDEAARDARAFLRDFPESERAAEVKKLLEEK
jgi:hypothetical protein